MALHLRRSAFVTTFYKVASGKELEIYSQFSDLYPDYIVHKVLGEFDLVSFLEVEELNDFRLSVPLSGLSANHTITACMWDGDDSYSSPSINVWLEGANIVGFVFLELDKLNYSLTPITNIYEKFLEYFYQSSVWKETQVAFYGGVGQTELFALIKADDFQELFDLAAYLRSVTTSDIGFPHDGDIVSLFCMTKTIPTLSYPNIIKPGAFDKISGEITPRILVSCPPGLENEISSKFKGINGCCESCLGGYDISVIFKDKIKSSVLIEQLLSFRSYWRNHNPVIIDTETHIFSSITTDAQITPYKVTAIEPFPEVPKVFTDAHANLAGRIKAFIYQVTANMALRDVYLSVIDISFFPLRILGEIDKYRKLKGSDKESSLRRIQEMLESAELGLAQRVSSEFHPNFSIQINPVSLSDGVFGSTVAINYIVRHIFGKWYSVFEPDIEKEEERWSGFILFNDVFGFQMRAGMVFSIPMYSAVSPLDKSVTWLALTHEISHAVWNLFCIDLKEEAIISKTLEAILGRTPDEGDRVDEKDLKGQFWELFANWYDYYMFFDEDHDYYQEFIWESWKELAIVRDSPEDYLFRSFLIYIASSEDEYDEAIALGMEDDYINRRWSEFESYLSHNLPFVWKMFDYTSLQDEVFELVYKLAKPFFKIANKYKNEQFKETINKEYPDLKDHVDKIRLGCIIDEEIKNPFLLLRESRRVICGPRKTASFSQSSALILSLINQKIFLV